MTPSKKWLPLLLADGKTEKQAMSLCGVFFFAFEHSQYCIQESLFQAVSMGFIL